MKIKKISLKNKIFQQAKVWLKGSIIRNYDFFSGYLNNHRHIDIYLPPGYFKNSNKTYPVVYMHDGNNLFDPKLSFGGVAWDVHKTLDILISNNLIEEVIVVGIHNTMGRNFEYTWHQMSFSNRLEGGGGNLYAKFIINELKSFIDNTYRTKKERKHTTVMGSSLGGLISFYFGLYCSDYFQNIGAISPSFWWKNGQIFHDTNLINNSLNIWLDMGTKEGQSKKVSQNWNIINTRAMKDLLIKKGYYEGNNLAYFEDRGAYHNESSWAKRLHLIFIYFFGKNKKLVLKK